MSEPAAPLPPPVMLESAELLRHAGRIAQLGIWELDLRSNHLVWSDEIFRIFELSPREFGATYAAFLDAIHPDDRELVDRAYRDSVASGRPYEVTHRLRMPDGRIKHVIERGETWRDADGVPLRSIGTIQDLTARIQLEEQVRVAEHSALTQRRLLKAIIDASPDWIFAKDRDHRLLLVNHAFAAAWARTPPQMEGRFDTEFWPADECERFHVDDRRAIAGEFVRNTDDVASVAEGPPRVFDTIKGPVRDEHGRPFGVFGISRDVTAAREAAQRLAAQLEEKEVLLRELHHRVKNNLQVVASLLNLQRAQATSPDVETSLRDAGTRIAAMALVHDKLHGFRDLARVDLRAYAEALATNLAVVFGSADRITVTVTGPAIELALDRATPCALILNELITNAFKHAFPAGRRGRVTVVLAEAGDDVTIEVVDDGIGLAPRPDAPGSLGLRLLPSLAAQVDATLEPVPGTPGTHHRLRLRRDHR